MLVVIYFKILSERVEIRRTKKLGKKFAKAFAFSGKYVIILLSV